MNKPIYFYIVFWKKYFSIKKINFFFFFGIFSAVWKAVLKN